MLSVTFRVIKSLYLDVSLDVRPSVSTLLSHSPVAVDCGGLPDPTDGQVGIPSGTTFNNTASYSCDPGYNLVGSMTRTCGDDGIWTLNEPTCDRKLYNTFYTELVMFIGTSKNCQPSTVRSSRSLYCIYQEDSMYTIGTHC